jgi:hypothetical protein
MWTYVPFRRTVASLQGAGGIYGMIALSPSVGVYAGSGRLTSHVPIRVVQPDTHPNHSLDLATVDNVYFCKTKDNNVSDTGKLLFRLS